MGVGSRWRAESVSPAGLALAPAAMRLPARVSLGWFKSCSNRVLVKTPPSRCLADSVIGSMRLGARLRGERPIAQVRDARDGG